MKTLLLFGGLCLSLNAFSQTTIFQENFETTNTNWTLNTGTGDNQWVINNRYEADLWGGILIPATTPQPSTFTGGSNSFYLHVYNVMMCTAFMTCSSNFDAESPADQSAEMTNAISTAGMDNINLSFWYLSGGDPGISFGSVEYTTDNGANWTQIGSEFSGVNAWTQITLTDAALSNQPALKFRFRWQNGATGTDPGFSIDELKITGQSSSAPFITTQAVTPMSACFNAAQNVSVPFNVSGVYTTGNIFTAQLSDANGSFSAPVSIGTLSTTATGAQSINAVIPAGTAVGTGYRIRIVSSAPAATGTDNGSNITVHTLPTVAISSVPANATITQGQSVTLIASGGTSYTWSPTTALTTTTSESTVVVNPTSTTTYTSTGTDANGCTASSSVIVTVNPTTNGIEEATKEEDKISLYPNPATESFEVLRPEGSGSIERLVIRDNKGRKVRTYDKPKPEKFFIADIDPGLYWVIIVIEDNVYVEKLLIP